MVTFEEFIKRFNNLEKFVKKEATKMLEAQGDMLVDMIVSQQREGLGSDGTIMQSGYSSGYAKRRKKKGLQTKYVDLHFTGTMHKGMKVIPVKGGVDVRSKEPYEYYVRANFPKGFSPTEENARKVSEVLSVLLAPKIKKYLVG